MERRLNFTFDRNNALPSRLSDVEDVALPPGHVPSIFLYRYFIGSGWLPFHHVPVPEKLNTGNDPWKLISSNCVTRELIWFVLY